MIFSYSRRRNWSSKGDILTAVKRSRLNHRTWWWRWLNWIPAVLLIMKIQLGQLYQCQRGLFKLGWRQIEISVSG
jgi:hypothetical protein